jgi:hypothetical protein
MSEDLKAAQRQIALGQMASDFLNSELGEFCIDMAEFEKEQAFAGLSNVDPEDSKEIRRLQNIIARHDDFSQWIRDLIETGNLAYQEYLLGDTDD